jgi:hypothetical protein
VRSAKANTPMPHCDALDAIDAPYRKRAKAVLDTLQSFFIEMPRGESFCERADFQRGYAALRRATREGADLTGDALLAAIAEEPRAWLVLRCIIGMSPGEVAYLAVEEAAASGRALVIDQADAREIDSRAKRGQQLLFEEPPRGRKQRYHDQLLRTVVPLLADVMGRPVPRVPADRVHRLDKLDTAGGGATIAKALSADRVPYSELLYERLLGRPFASHRDSVSGIVGRLIENAIEELLDLHGIDGRATRARESVPGFVQAPDFLIPSKNAKVIIEAKLTEDDGTARDKVARVQTLRQYEDERPPAKRRTIVAVIDGRGFGYRPADLNRMLKACEGHVYTLDELDKLVGNGGPLRPYVGTRKP